ncbi:LysM peptidoglycan-binding domain-containing protein [Kurthia sibirica]|nr:LysM domain-containing protein [Kurthia sibirica]GEK35525.1 hypothetical protein KSI01_30580 [Kurthia sibirica]
MNRKNNYIPVIALVGTLFLSTGLSMTASATDSHVQKVIRDGRILTVPTESKVTESSKKQARSFPASVTEQKLSKYDNSKKQKRTLVIRNQDRNILWVANQYNDVEQALKHQNIGEAEMLQGAYYEIQNGDTLSVISHVTNIPLSNLVSANNIYNQHLIYASDSLYLKK